MARHLATSGFAVLLEESSHPRAHWLAGGLEAAGIPTHVEEDNLADEFAMSQRLMGTHRIRVLVPAARLDEARIVLQGLSQPIPIVDEEDDEALEALGEVHRERRSTIAVILIAVILGGPAVGWFALQGFLSLFGR